MVRKLKKPLITFIIILAVVAIPLLIGSTTQINSLNDSRSTQGITPPTAPSEATFAGETIKLDRMDLRERLDRELLAFSYMHSSSILMIKRANRYFPLIEALLKENNIPDDLKYLMVIESSMNTEARSPAGAAGFWQFMKGTARDFKLEVNNNIDERYHIEKSTHAACSYLRGAYNKYGDWLTAAASYNAGQGRITNELRRQDVDHASDLWLVQETSRYMFRLIAVKMMFENPKRFGFFLTEEQLYPPIEYKEVVINEPIPDLISFAKTHDLTLAQLKEANPWLRGRTLENNSRRTYTILIPTKESIYYKPESIKAHQSAWVIK